MAEEIFKDLGFAKLDISRRQRTGMGETVYCPGKTKEQLAGILKAFREESVAVLGTKCSPEQYEYITTAGVLAEYDPVSRVLTASNGFIPEQTGRVAVCTGGTADIPVPGQNWKRPTGEEMNQAKQLAQSSLYHVAVSSLSSSEALDLTARDDRFAVKVIAGI